MPWIVWLIAAVVLGVAEYFTLTLPLDCSLPQRS